MDIIKEFQGEFRWLSNFAPCEILFVDGKYKSVEHAYMSAKSFDPEWKEFCQTEEKPGVIKKASRGIELIPNWNELKLIAMADCLVQKFNQKPYKQKLMDTGIAYIQEGNRWGDTFWGVDLRTGKGCNTLGVMIMAIRASLFHNVK